MTTDNNYKFHIEFSGQHPNLWNLYTQLTFCYELLDSSSHQHVIDTLNTGLERLATSFPWIAGQVVRQKNWNSTNRDYYHIKSFEKTPRLVVKYLSHYLPPWDEFQRSKFPIRFLNENIIAPRNTKSVADESDPKPVLLLQVTFVNGGVLLTFAAQHGTLDIVGQGEMIRLLSKACRNEPFTDEELELGNRDRRTVIPFLDDTSRESPTEDNRETTQYLSCLPTTVINNAEAPTQNNDSKKTWSNFIVPYPSLTRLKQISSNSLPPNTAFISTDDSLSAFIWQRISHARSPHHLPTQLSTFARTIDVRHHLNLPSTYPGNVATKTYTTLTFAQLTSEPLGSIAAALRRSIDPDIVDVTGPIRAAAAAFIGPSPIDTESPPRDLSRDIAFSSWAKVTVCYELDFGLGLGRPAAIRRPSFAPPGDSGMEGVVYLLPRGPDGEIVVTLCLREDEMVRLRNDRVWAEAAVDIG